MRVRAVAAAWLLGSALPGIALPGSALPGSALPGSALMSVAGSLLSGPAPSAAPAPAQRAPQDAVQRTGTLHGVVTRAESGAPVAGATVRITGPAGTQIVVSDAAGIWRAAGLAPGAYTIRVGMPGLRERTVSVAVPRDAEPVATSLEAAVLPLDALVVTASRRTQRLADVPVTTELITRAQVEQARVSELSTLLVEQTGIQLEGGHPAGEGVMLQGMGSERVLILLDGQPMVGRLSGTIDLSRIPTSIIERVEIVKGPQSSLYGSEAMGGVINVITRDAARAGRVFGIDLTAGTQGRTDAAGSASGAIGGLEYVADAGRRMTELTPGRSDERGALAERWDGLVKLAGSPARNVRLHGSALLLDERQRWQAGQIFHFADNRQWSVRAGAELVRGAQRLAPTLYATEFDHISRSATSSSPVRGTGQRERQRLWEAELLYNGNWRGTALDIGLEASREEIDSERVSGGRRSQHKLEPFAQAEWVTGGVTFVPGLRATWSEQWGSHLAPRLATLIRPTSSVAIRASVGAGFRAPSFKETHMQFLNIGPGFGYAVRGNPDLLPERSRSASLGAEWSGNRTYLRGQLFHTRFSDFIETQLEGDSSGITLHTYGNIGRGRNRGVELEAGATAGAARMEAGYGWLDARDLETGEPLLGRPEHSGRLSLSYAMPFGLRAALTGLYTGSTPAQRTDAGIVERPAFTRFDVRLMQTLPHALTLTVGARNLFDGRPADWPGFAGRHLFIGLAWRAVDGGAHSPNIQQTEQIR